MINQKFYSSCVIVFSISTIMLVIAYFLHYVSVNIVMLLLGITQIFGGLSQINMSKPLNNASGINKTNKIVGVFAIIVGCTILAAVLAKMLLQ